MEQKVFKTYANGIDFYCELRGSGPKVVLVPDGTNDCGTYGKLADYLADEFTVLTFDMRGGTRSMDDNPQKVTPKLLADDVAAIMKALDFAPASVFGCSSGGQAVLSLGKYYPELARNIMVHEAALQSDAPIANTGYELGKTLFTFAKYCTGGINPGIMTMVCNADRYMELDEDCRQRMAQNGVFWGQWYLGTVDTDSYTAEDFSRMPPTSFTVGAWSYAWVVYANIETAKRGNCPVTWINSAHLPNISCPEEYAKYLKETIKKYL
ncbi:MAG: alpha/beta hydrolase [Oscillospiraceae bacterium]|nr:alpha/beta hydrolase [Oscillospiraceae bacterium]